MQDDWGLGSQPNLNVNSVKNIILLMIVHDKHRSYDWDRQTGTTKHDISSLETGRYPSIVVDYSTGLVDGKNTGKP